MAEIMKIINYVQIVFSLLEIWKSVTDQLQVEANTLIRHDRHA